MPAGFSLVAISGTTFWIGRDETTARPASGDPYCSESGGVSGARGASGTLVWIAFPRLH